MKPLFMWAGGKTRLVKHYKPFFPKGFEVYAEPFFGGGSMLLEALKINPAAKVFINDINSGIINIYQTIQAHPEEFLQKMDSLSSRYLPLTKEDRKKFYYDLRNEHAFSYETMTKIEEASVLYFLMKTGFNGIWQVNKNTNDRFGTPCGLLNQTTSVYNSENIKAWHEVLKNATITSGEFTSNLVANEKTWVFMDPPYRGGNTTYGTVFEDKHQKLVLDVARMLTKDFGAEVWVSNRDLGDGFFDNQPGFDLHKFDVTYTAGRRKKTEAGFEAKKAKEVLLVSRKV
jgi:DNA adenine methylase